MLSDLAKSGARRSLSADVCIIGGGPAGITIAEALMETGATILLAESGGLTTRARDRDLDRAGCVGHPMDPTEGRHRGLGGSAQRWGGRCAMLDPLDLSKRPWIAHSGWPIAWEELVRYYPAAQYAAGFSIPWDEDRVAARLIDSATDGLGNELVKPFVWRFAVPDRRDPAPRPARLPHRRAIDWGRERLAALRRAPNVEVVLHANLVELVPAADCRSVTAARFRSLSGRELHVSAGIVVLCCGGIENPRILLNLDRAMSTRLAGSAVLGRFFMQHPRGTIATAKAPRADLDRISGVVGIHSPSVLSPMQIELGFALTEEAQRRKGLLNASASIVNAALEAAPWPAAKTIAAAIRRRSAKAVSPTLVGRMLRGVGELVQNLWDKYVLGRPLRFRGGHFEVVADFEQQPCAESRVSLSDEVDGLGVRKAVIDWKISQLERTTALTLAQGICRELERIGFRHIRMAEWLTDGTPLTDRHLFGTYHFIGATRMADSPAEGVVDRDCRVFGLSNLYVAGCSVFPTGGHANPTLTILALAIRLGDHLRSIVSEMEPSQRAIRQTPSMAEAR